MRRENTYGRKITAIIGTRRFEKKKKRGHENTGSVAKQSSREQKKGFGGKRIMASACEENLSTKTTRSCPFTASESKQRKGSRRKKVK